MDSFFWSKPISLSLPLSLSNPRIPSTTFYMLDWIIWQDVLDKLQVVIFWVWLFDADSLFWGLGAEIVQPTNLGQQNATEEPVKQSSTTSVFVNTEPLREDQIQNAVKFLSHPKVKGSPVIYRRSFLEKKGLTKEEIDEAFRRVPVS